MKKKVLALTLALVLLFSLISMASAADYDDHESKPYIDEALARGWMNGYGDGTFRPGNSITRAEFAVMVWRALGSPHDTAGSPFTDVPTGTYYYDAVLALAQMGVITGIGGGLFAPDSTLTRETGYTMLARAFGLTAANPFACDQFSDSASISSWAKDAVSALTESGYAEGIENNRFAPQENLTRGATAKLLVTISDGDDSSVAKDLYAGAGVGEIDLTGLFDKSVGGPYEGFSGEIADAPHARVLLLESNRVKVAIVSIELVNAPQECIDICKEVVNKITGTPMDNIWVHATHAITTPHIGSKDAQIAMFLTACRSAITKAAKQAIDSFQPAVAGAGSGECDVNANRNVLLNGKYYYGLNSTYGESNKTMTILRVDSVATGKPIGFLVNYGMKPDVINNTQMSVDGRSVSSDAPGYLCTKMEEKYGAPTLYLMGDAADQVAQKTADYYALNSADEAARVQLSVKEGLAFVAEIGNKMTSSAIKIVDSINVKSSNPVIALSSTSFSWPNKNGTTSGTVAVSALRIGDNLALVGLKPEVNALTGLSLQAASPFANTMIVSFLNGDQKYMPDAQAYVDGTWEVSRTDLSSGAAEKFVDVSTQLLNSLKK